MEAIKYFSHILMDHEIFYKIFDGPHDVLLCSIFLHLFFKLRELECKISKLVINEIWITRQDFNSGRYHRDMKILKILASNSKQFWVYGIFKKLQIDDDRRGTQILHFLRWLLLKKPLVLEIPLGMLFEKNDIKIALKPTSTKL